MFDQEDWERRVRYFTNGDTTFEEAYKKTGRVLCIALSATTKKAPPVLINYITAPNVTIASAVLASAAVPGFIDPMKLQLKDDKGVVRKPAKQDETYRDGSIESDIPKDGLAEMVRVLETLNPISSPIRTELTHHYCSDIEAQLPVFSCCPDKSPHSSLFLQQQRRRGKGECVSVAKICRAGLHVFLGTLI